MIDPTDRNLLVTAAAALVHTLDECSALPHDLPDEPDAVQRLTGRVRSDELEASLGYFDQQCPAVKRHLLVAVLSVAAEAIKQAADAVAHLREFADTLHADAVAELKDPPPAADDPGYADLCDLLAVRALIASVITAGPGGECEELEAWDNELYGIFDALELTPKQRDWMLTLLVFAAHHIHNGGTEEQLFDTEERIRASIEG
jgi:hypothetical protein